MASNTNTLYVTFADIYHNLLKIWGQKNRIGASYIERQLIHITPELNRTPCLHMSQIRAGMLCYVKCSENSYYRARVISYLDNDLVHVVFVDVGSRDIIHISNIKIRSGNEDVLLKMAEQAEEYCLAGVVAPAGGWPKEDINKIRLFICNKEVIYNEIRDTEGLKLIAIKHENQSFSNFLIEKKIAHYASVDIQSQLILTYFRSDNILNPGKTLEEAAKINVLTGLPLSDKQTSLKISSSKINRREFKTQCTTSPTSSVPINLENSPIKFFNTKRVVSPIFKTLPNSDKSNLNNSFHNSNQMSTTNDNSMTRQNPHLLSNPSSLNLKERHDQIMNSYQNGMIRNLSHLQFKQNNFEENVNFLPQDNIPHNYFNSVLEVGSTHKVCISCIDDGPWSFSIQLISNENDMNKLMEELTQSELLPIKLPMVLGNPCIGASVLHKSLCRGVVVSLSLSAAKVYFVDFGSTEDLPVSSIYEIPSRFFQTKVLSQKFCLSGLQKVTYSEEIKEHFNDVVQDKLLILRVTSLGEENLPSCDLYLKDVNIKRILNERVQNSRILNNFNPKIGDSENVVITWIDSVQKFYVQLQRREPQLNALKNELSEAGLNGEKMLFEDLRVGLKCICKYHIDGQWYRAIIMSFLSESKITVFYFDYGNTEEVNITFLKKIKTSSLINDLENQAIQCCLHGLDSKFNEQALSNAFECLVMEKDLKMNIDLIENGQLHVKLFLNEEDIVPLLINSHGQSSHEPNKKSSTADCGWRERNYSTHNQNFSSFNKKGSTDFNKKFDKSNENNAFSGKNRPRDEDNWRERKPNLGNNENNTKIDKLNKGLKKNEMKYTSDNEGVSAGTNNKNDKKSYSNGEKLNVPSNKKLTPDKQSSLGKKEGNEPKKPIDKKAETKTRFTERKFRSNFERDKFGKENRNDFKSSKTSPLEKSNNSSENKNSKESMKKEGYSRFDAKFKDNFVKNNTCEKGIITYYISPDEFYIQLLNKEADFKKMMEDIQVYYSDKNPFKYPLKADNVVIAQFLYDNILYRGEVVKSNPLTVRYVDYGNQEEVEPSRTWPVANQFFSLPKQAFKCRLANVIPNGKEWPSLGSNLDKFFEFEEYKCKFVGYRNDVYEVILEDLSSGKDVGTEIIASGFGKLKEIRNEISNIDFSLLPKQTLKLFVTHVQNPFKFYVLLNPASKKIIEEEIKLWTSNKKSLQPIENINSENKYLVSNDDKSWHRGIVTNIGDTVTVHLIDSGEVVNIHKNKVFQLPDHLKSFSPQAVECSLSEKLMKSDFDFNSDFKLKIENKFNLVHIVSVDDERLSVIVYDENGKKFDFYNENFKMDNVDPIGQLPIIMQNVPIKVSHVEHPEEVYISREEDMPEFQNLISKLTQFYKNFSTTEFCGNEGDLIAFKSNDEETWYRGKAIGFSKNMVEVFNIDFGKKELVSHKKVHKLDVSFFTLHSCAKKVRLNVENLNGIETKLKNLFQNNLLFGFFINEEGVLISELILNGKSVNSLLNMKNSYCDKFDSILANHKVTAISSACDLSKNDCSKDTSKDLKVLVVHIDSPKKFWVHKESSLNDLEAFQEKLQMYCESTADKQNPEVQNVVGAMFSNVWYRAVVLSVKENNLTVEFIDYGNILEIDLNSNSIKELPKDLIDVPIFATQFSLKGNWKENATAKFEEIIEEYEDLVSVVILEESNPVVVDLYKDGESIYDILMREGVGDTDETKIDAATNSAFEAVNNNKSETSITEDNKEESKEPNENKLVTVYISHCNSPDDFYIQKESSTEVLQVLSNALLEAHNFEDAVTKEENKLYAAKFPNDGVWYRAKLLRKIEEGAEVFFVDFGNISIVNEIKYLPIDLTEIPFLSQNICLIYGNNCDSWSQKACEKFLEYNDEKPLKMKTIVERRNKPIVELYFEEKSISEELESYCENDGRSNVYVCHVDSPSCFYVRYAEDEKFDFIKKLLENGKDCENLLEQKPGTLCLVANKEENVWYRGKILRTLDDGCEVYLIDYGKVLISRNLKRLLPDLSEIPPRAIKCSLNLPERNIPEIVKDEFIKLMPDNETIFRMRIIASGEVKVVSLKLNGRILEQTLSSDFVSETLNDKAEKFSNHRNDSDNSKEGTDDDKNSKKFFNASKNLEDDVRAGSSLLNETDEEKRFKIAVNSTDGGSEGFKSDDEKEIAEATSSLLNVTDNDLMEDTAQAEINLSEITVSAPTDESKERVSNENLQENFEESVSDNLRDSGEITGDSIINNSDTTNDAQSSKIIKNNSSKE